MSDDPKKNRLEQAKEHMRKLDPFFDQVEAALDQFYTGQRVTEILSANGKRIVVERSKRIGRIRLRAGDVLLRTIKLKPQSDIEGPLWDSSEDLQPSSEPPD